MGTLHMLRRAVSLFRLLVVLAGCSVAVNSRAQGGGKIPEVERAGKVTIAPASELRDDPHADSMLAGLLQAYLARVQGTVGAPTSGDFAHQLAAQAQAKARAFEANRGTLRSLVAFADGNRAARAALRAKFAIARMLERYFRDWDGLAVARRMYQEIVDGYPGSAEAALSKLRILEFDLREQKRRDFEKGAILRGPSLEVRQCLNRIKEEIARSEAVIHKLDGDPTALGTAFKRFLLWTPGGSLDGRYRLLLAATLEELGDNAEAKRIYEGILRDLPKSTDAKDAALALESMRIMEKLGAP